MRIPPVSAQMPTAINMLIKSTHQQAHGEDMSDAKRCSAIRTGRRRGSQAELYSVTLLDEKLGLCIFPVTSGLK